MSGIKITEAKLMRYTNHRKMAFSITYGMLQRHRRSFVGLIYSEIYADFVLNWRGPLQVSEMGAVYDQSYVLSKVFRNSLPD